MFNQMPRLLPRFYIGIVYVLSVASSHTVSALNTTLNTTFSENGAQNGSSVIPLYIGAFFPFGGSWDGSGIIPAVEMALDDINSREDILPGYELRMVWNDTQCEAGLGTRVLVDQIYSEPQKIMLLGGGCSTATQAIAATAYHWNLVTMSYAASSSALSNRNVYPYFYRTYMPDAMYNPSRVRLMRDFNWTRVATIHENHELFSLAIDDIHNMLVNRKITLISSESFAENPHNQVVNLKNQDARIIVSNMYEDKARRVFCEAYQQGITGKGYVWMLIGWYNDKWWEKEDPDVTCSRTEMREAVRGYIAMESLQLGDPSVVTVANITSNDYVKQLKERLKWPQNRDYDWNLLAPYGYDAAWAIALMLNQTAQTLKTKTFSDYTTRRLEDFNYDDNEMARMFFDTLNDTNFIGVTGPVSFKDGDRVGITQIEQLQVICEDTWHVYKDNCYKFMEPPAAWSNAKATCQLMNAEIASSNNETLAFIRQLWREDSSQQPTRIWLSKDDANCGHIPEPSSNQCPTISFRSPVGCNIIPCMSQVSYACVKQGDLTERRIGLYNALNDELQWLSPIIWPGDQIPLDHTPVVQITEISINKGVSQAIFVVFCSLAVVGIILALSFLAFNLKLRNQKSVKLSSPKINNLIILGSLVIYIWIILYGCSTNLVSEKSFMAICRVRHWFLSIGFILSFGAMFSKTWRVYRVAIFKKPKRVIVRDTHLFLMVLALVCLDVILLVIWQGVDAMTVKRTYLQAQDDPDVTNQIIQTFFDSCDSHYYGYWLAVIGGYKGLLLIFGTFLAWETRKVKIDELNDSKLIGISVYNVVILCAVGVAVSVTVLNPTYAYIFLSCIVLFCTSVTLIIIFVPKMIGVYRDPEGKTVSIHRRSISISGATTGSENMESLQGRIKKLEDELRKSKPNTADKNCGTGPQVANGNINEFSNWL